MIDRIKKALLEWGKDNPGMGDFAEEMVEWLENEKSDIEQMIDNLEGATMTESDGTKYHFIPHDVLVSFAMKLKN